MLCVYTKQFPSKANSILLCLHVLNKRLISSTWYCFDPFHVKGVHNVYIFMSFLICILHNRREFHNNDYFYQEHREVDFNMSKNLLIDLVRQMSTSSHI